MTSKDMTEQGVAALKEGDSKRAHDLLQQAVELDPENAKAWFFLSKTQTSSADKRASLEKVLAIMPNNKPAQEALAKLDSAPEEDFSDFEEPAMSGASASSSRSTSPSGAGFKLPVDIPGAPEKVDPKNVIEEFVETFKNGIAILKRTEGVYPMEIQRASWWRFWQYVVVAWIISSIASTIASVILQAQLAAIFNEYSAALGTQVYQSPSIISILLTLILTVPIGIGALYAGIYASHRWVTSSRNGQGSLVGHAYTLILPSVTASIIGNVLGVVFMIIPILGGLVGIFSLILAIYALYIASGGVSILHKVDKNSGYITVAIMLVVQIVAGIILGIIMSPFILTSGLGFI